VTWKWKYMDKDEEKNNGHPSDTKIVLGSIYYDFCKLV